MLSVTQENLFPRILVNPASFSFSVNYGFFLYVIRKEKMIEDTVTLSHVICFIILNLFNLASLKSFVATVVYYMI